MTWGNKDNKNGKKKRRKKLTRAIQGQVLLVAVLLLVVSTGLNFLVFFVQTNTLVSISVESQLHIFRKILGEVEGVPEFAAAVMDTYHTIPGEIRSQPESEEYHAYQAKYRDEHREEINAKQRDRYRRMKAEKQGVSM